MRRTAARPSVFGGSRSGVFHDVRVAYLVRKLGVEMKRSSRSKWEEWVDGDDGPAEVRSSGVRERGTRPFSDEAAPGPKPRAPAEPLPDERPCTSFDDVYRRHWRFVLSRIHESVRDDPSGAEDVCQLVFMRLDRRIQRDACVPDPLVPALAGLIHDEVRNHLRSKKRRREDDPPDSEMPSSKPDPEQLLWQAERRVEEKRRALAIFARMDADDVTMIKLAHMGELSLKDIAGKMGIAEGTVRVRLSRARVKLATLCRLTHETWRKT